MLLEEVETDVGRNDVRGFAREDFEDLLGAAVVVREAGVDAKDGVPAAGVDALVDLGRVSDDHALAAEGVEGDFGFVASPRGGLGAGGMAVGSGPDGRARGGREGRRAGSGAPEPVDGVVVERSKEFRRRRVGAGRGLASAFSSRRGADGERDDVETAVA